MEERKGEGGRGEEMEEGNKKRGGKIGEERGKRIGEGRGKM